MPGEFRCECGGRVAVLDGVDRLNCNRCGVEYAVASARADMLWHDDPTAALALASAGGATKKPPPRPVGEPVWAPSTVTMDFYEKLANTPLRKDRRKWKRIRQALVGGGLLATAGLVYRFQLDAGFASVGSVMLAAFGLVSVFQAMLGNDR